MLTQEFLHIYAKTQPTAASNSAVIEKKTHIPIKLGIYSNIGQAYMVDVCAYMCHI